MSNGALMQRKRGETKSIVSYAVGIFLGSWLFLTFYAYTFIDSKQQDINKPTHISPNKAVNIDTVTTPGKEKTKHKTIQKSPWEGWQPLVEEDCDSIRKCFRESHSCPKTCRDEEFGEAPEPPNEWIPDVEVLSRMKKAGKDSNGNKWPPSLSTEYCEDIGFSGGKQDGNKVLLDTVPISVNKTATSEVGPRILCMIYTMREAHDNKVRAIRETWAGECDGFLAFSTESDPRIPAISIPHDGKEEYSNMWQKVRSIWKFVGDHYVNDFDYFFLGGDDLFVIPHNLRAYLSTLGSPDEPHFAGRRFHGYGAKDNYFNSGGAGYALSRKMAKEFVHSLDDPTCEPDRHTSMEDVMIAQCLRRKLDIGLTDTRDSQDRERFHPFAPATHFTWKPPHGKNKDWYEEYNKEWGIKLGAECCAPDSVSFHYIKKPAMVRHMFALLYNCKR